MQVRQWSVQIFRKYMHFVKCYYLQFAGEFCRMAYRIILVLACVMFCNKLVVIFQATYRLVYSWGRFLVGLLSYIIQNCNICFGALASWLPTQIATVFIHFYFSLEWSTNRWDFLYFKNPIFNKKECKI